MGRVRGRSSPPPRDSHPKGSSLIRGKKRKGFLHLSPADFPHPPLAVLLLLLILPGRGMPRGHTRTRRQAWRFDNPSVNSKIQLHSALPTVPARANPSSQSAAKASRHSSLRLWVCKRPLPSLLSQPHLTVARAGGSQTPIFTIAPITT